MSDRQSVIEKLVNDDIDLSELIQDCYFETIDSVACQRLEKAMTNRVNEVFGVENYTAKFQILDETPSLVISNPDFEKSIVMMFKRVDVTLDEILGESRNEIV